MREISQRSSLRSLTRDLSSDTASGAIRIYDGRGDGKPLETITSLHRSPVHLMAVSLVTLLLWFLEE